MESRCYFSRHSVTRRWGVHPISATDLFGIQIFFAASACALQRLPAVQRAAQVFEDRDLLPDLARKVSRQILYIVHRIEPDRVLKPLHIKRGDLADERQRVAAIIQIPVQLEGRHCALTPPTGVLRSEEHTSEL